MRTLSFLAIAASMAMASTVAESAPMGGGTTVPMTRDWGSVPTIPLRPPVTTTPQAPAGNWSSEGGWRDGRTRWQDHTGQARGSWGQWRGGAGKWAGRFQPRRGVFMPRRFVSPTFFVSDWWSYGLAEPRSGQRWVRYYDDAALIDERGYVYDTAPGVDWDGYGQGDDDDRYYDDRYSGWGSGVYHAPPYGSAVYYAPAGATTVIVQSAPVVTTTTTTTYVDEEVVHARPKRAWRPRSKCACK